MSGRSHVLDAVPGLRSLAAAQLGVVRRHQLAELGVTRHHVRRQVEAGRWRVVGPHVVVLQTGRLERRQQMFVAVLHCGDGAALAGRTALEHDGLRGWEVVDLHVLVPRGRQVLALPRVVVHQTQQLPAEHVRTRLPTACTPARALVDAASWERSPRVAAALTVAVFQQRLARYDDVLPVLDALTRARHSLVVRQAALEAAQGSESLSELRVLRALRHLGVKDVMRQLVVETPSGPRRLDLVVRLSDGRMLAIEVDGVHHADPRQRAADAVRDAELVALGYVVLRLPAAATSDPRWLRARLEGLVSADLSGERVV